MPPADPLTLRSVARRAVRDEITLHALALFADQGFAATTVDNIAHAAGISPRSFFRYFATKEDVVIGDAEAMAEVLLGHLVNRPAGESGGPALRNAVVDFISDTTDDVEVAAQRSMLMLSTPSLRARHLEKQLMWQEILTPETMRRLPHTCDSLDARTLVAVVLSCLDLAVVDWAADRGRGSVASRLDQCLAMAARGF